VAAPPATIGLVATAGTLASGFYQRRLAAAGYTALPPEAEDLAHYIVPAIHAVKSGRVEEGGHGFVRAAQALRESGAAAVILACTEVPPALAAVAMPSGMACVDATAALARACVDAWTAGTLQRATGGAEQ
jgi:aspartate racemase